MKVFLNPGHAPNGDPDPGACGCGLEEHAVAKAIADRVETYLEKAGVFVVGNLQSDSLGEITAAANASGADVFISIHCNAFNGQAHGTEVEIYPGSRAGELLAACIQAQIVGSLGTMDRGLKERPNLYVLKHTDMPAVLVETAFIDNEADAAKLRDRQDEFARAIARGVTDFEGKEGV
nr:MAG TPA: Cell wall hydrolase autolysin [Caudoviricetes sp.]